MNETHTFFFFWVCCSLLLEAQTPLVETISIEQGLSQGFVPAICQDDDGFLWFATKNGLNRYDGYQFQVFKNDPFDSLSLQNNELSHVYASGDFLILHTNGKNVQFFHRKTHCFYAMPSFGSTNFLHSIFPIDHNSVGMLFMEGGNIALYLIRWPSDLVERLEKGATLKDLLRIQIPIRRPDLFEADLSPNQKKIRVWLRLVRNGSNFVGYTSIDGTNWRFAFSATVSMAGCIYAGVFAESINAAATTTATFSNVSVNSTSNSSLANGLPETQPATEQDVQVQIFPNPTTGEVTIDLDIHAGKPGTIQVFNALGALTMQERLIPGNPESHRLRIGDIAGVYTVVIQLEGHKIVRRVVVQSE